MLRVSARRLLHLPPPRIMAALVAGLLGTLTGVAAATPCVSPADCGGGACVDDVCCDSACASPCMGCSTAAKGGGVDGVCELVTAGHDPHDDCADDGAASCGQDGTCDAAGKCAIYAAGTVCVPGSCDGEAFASVPADLCDGAGTCVDSGPPVPCLHNNPCVFDLCADTGCETVTKTDGTDCGGGQTCLDGVCGMGSTTVGTGGGGGAGPATSTATATGGGSDGAGGEHAPPNPRADDAAPSGCSCRTAPSHTEAPLALSILLAAAALRRRRSHTAA